MDELIYKGKTYTLEGYLVEAEQEQAAPAAEAEQVKIASAEEISKKIKNLIDNKKTDVLASAFNELFGSDETKKEEQPAEQEQTQDNSNEEAAKALEGIANAIQPIKLDA